MVDLKRSLYYNERELAKEDSDPKILVSLGFRVGFGSIANSAVGPSIGPSAETSFDFNRVAFGVYTRCPSLFGQ